MSRATAATLRNSAEIRPSDRLGMTLFLAIVVHATVILGVTYKADLTRPPTAKSPPIEIRLMHQRSEKAPDDTDVYAQANLDGGGDPDARHMPRSPAFAPINPEQPGMDSEVRMPASPPEAKPRAQTRPLTQQHSEQKTPQTEISVLNRKAPLTADELVARSLEIASLSAEISQSMEAYAQRGRHRYIISAHARELRDAAYLDAWRAKVERIGNLNYPDEAKRRNISGSLLLDVAINADGSLSGVTLIRSSGSKVLDDAAMRIVHLAAPFSPFSDDMRRDTDVLHITRNWEFLDGNRLEASR
jgi:protein TonB